MLLPLAALVAALALIGVHVASGGADYAPTATADPCRNRPLPPKVDDLDPLAQTLVLLGVQRAACTLGVTRERLVVALPSGLDRAALAREAGTDERGLVQALTGGLRFALVRLDRGDRLPRASDLRDNYADDLGLPGIAEEAVRRIPDGVVDELLPTEGVLERALAGIDVQRLLNDLDDPGAIQTRLEQDIKDAALAEAKERLLDRLPRPLRDLLGVG